MATRLSFADHEPLLPPSYEYAQTTRPTKHPLPPCAPPEIVPNQRRKFNDAWAAGLFFLTMAVFAVLAAIGIPLAFKSLPDAPGDDGLLASRDGSWAKPVERDPTIVECLTFLFASFGTAIGFSCLYLWLLVKIPRTLIDISYGIPIVLLSLSAVTSLVVGNVIGGLIFGGFAALSIWASGLSDHRFNGTVFVGIGFGVVCVPALRIFWVSQLIVDINHLTVAGVVATFFFTGVQQPESDVVFVPVRDVTSQALYRSVTSAFGTVCFSSLLNAIVQTLKYFARKNYDDNVNSEDRNIFAILFSACILTIISIFGDVLDIFNKYSLTEVAIYGKPYCEAGKDTWNLFKMKGIDVIINDCAVSKVVGMGGIMCDRASISVVIAIFVNIFLGLFVFLFVGRVVDSAATAMYVCLAEDPATIQKLQPDLFAEVENCYPEATWGVQSIAYNA
ncbi:hypothetical protein BCR33DRAFT_713450 [Rhizoclosmatium globosum]|uniref:Protein PNS1 n=1 Tax=Rhizoclosmatium globosum TaxID=329046 RepID=A0A1Y2CS18_9FUNG|nr:hypothetical protein BCR33DRAFT_713450 [Rhizoclosmatium globosum]|eukprot:ORY49849.1 hypothetical protein BCR33DRAFT_713450 [Rhizoclosmatium globosum]